jgi:hypothetical protein
MDSAWVKAAKCRIEAAGSQAGLPPAAFTKQSCQQTRLARAPNRSLLAAILRRL